MAVPNDIPRFVAAAALLLAVTPACADRARAGPAADPVVAPTAVELAAVVESPEGRVELRAGRATLDPGFPERLAGRFDDAAFAVSPSAPRTKEVTPGDDPTLRDFAVRARRMRYEARGGRASFSGDVVVSLDPLRLTCDALEVTYHRAEGFVDFVATGSVRAEREGLRASAGKAQYQGADGLLTLTESPRVEGDAGILEGARIVLDVDDETVSIEEVRGTFRVRPP
jgi:lipopolysaccharide transport protein LptA